MATIKVEIGDPRRPLKWQSIQLALPPRNIYTIIPAPVRNRIGIRPYIEDKFLMPDGSRVKRRKGVAKFRYMKKIGGSDVIFGRPGDPTLIGELTLGSLGLELDRNTGGLKPLRMILAPVS
jgi:hypothetical protein